MNYQKLNILLIDDMKTIHMVFKNEVEKLGIYNLTITKNITEAWDYLEKNSTTDKKIDIIFCDWHMPGGDGDQILNKLRNCEDENLKWTKFIMATGTDEKISFSMQNGANNIIKKRFHSSEIKNKLDLIYK